MRKAALVALLVVGLLVVFAGSAMAGGPYGGNAHHGGYWGGYGGYWGWYGGWYGGYWNCCCYCYTWNPCGGQTYYKPHHKVYGGYAGYGGYSQPMYYSGWGGW